VEEDYGGEFNFTRGKRGVGGSLEYWREWNFSGIYSAPGGCRGFGLGGLGHPLMS
jgi:hypothetical protein